MSKLNSPYIVPVLVLALVFSAVPQIGTTIQLHSNPVAAWWDDLFGGSSSETELTGTYNIFIDVDGVDGESKDDAHDKWIEVLSSDFSMSSPSSGTGSTRRRGEIVFEDIILTKEIDKSTPKLQEKCAKGAVIPEVEIDVTRNVGGYPITVIRYVLKNVMLTSFISTAGTSEEPPMDTFTLNYEEIKVTYTELDDEGGSKGNVEWEYKLELGEF